MLIPQRVFKNIIDKYGWEPCIKYTQMDLINRKRKIVLTFDKHEELECVCSPENAHCILDS